MASKGNQGKHPGAEFLRKRQAIADAILNTIMERYNATQANQDSDSGPISSEDGTGTPEQS